jgi:DNA anti-recombination protein RmuC
MNKPKRIFTGGVVREISVVDAGANKQIAVVKSATGLVFGDGLLPIAVDIQIDDGATSVEKALRMTPTRRARLAEIATAITELLAEFPDEVSLEIEVNAEAEAEVNAEAEASAAEVTKTAAPASEVHALVQVEAQTHNYETMAHAVSSAVTTDVKKYIDDKMNEQISEITKKHDEQISEITKKHDEEIAKQISEITKKHDEEIAKRDKEIAKMAGLIETIKHTAPPPTVVAASGERDQLSVFTGMFHRR